MKKIIQQAGNDLGRRPAEDYEIARSKSTFKGTGLKILTVEKKQDAC